MRNLKRALSLTLASVMLLGMMVVGTSAKGYDDVDADDNVEAIEVLQAVEVMVGDDRGFGPDRPVTRNEMAVVMGKLLNLNYNYYASSCPFTDVAEWARGWVGACYANGIVSGRGDGIYDGEATVTAIEAASMMMRALGYFKYAEDYADGFQLATVRQGSDIGIFNDVGSDGNTAMTRNQVAQMSLNALRSNMVTFTGTPGIEVNGVKVGYRAEYTPRTGTDRKYDAISGLTTTLNTNNQYYIQLGEELYDGDLRLEDDTDDFGRPSRRWVYDGTEIGTYAKDELLRKEYSAKVTGRDLYDLLGTTIINNSDWDLYVSIDGDDTANEALFGKSALTRTNTDGVGATQKGVLTQVYVNSSDKEVYIAIINTFLAIASEDYDSKNGEVDLDVYAVRNAGTSRAPEYIKDKEIDGISVTVEDEDIDISGVKEDDMFLVTMAKGKVQSMTAPEVLAGSEITSFKKNSDVVSDGKTYEYADTAKYDSEVLTDYSQTNLKDTTYNIILDRYGYLIGLEQNEDADQYVFLTGMNGNTSDLATKNADANVIFLDGRMETVSVNVSKSALPTSGPQMNTWCTYSVSSDNVYTLNQVATTTADAPKIMQSAQDADAELDDEIEINNKNISLKAITGTGNAYGNDDTVYLAVSTDVIKAATAAAANRYHHVIINDVESRTVGTRNTSLVAPNQAALGDGTGTDADNAVGITNEVFTLYNDKGYIIAAVVIGEEEGVSKTFAYVHSDGVNREKYDKPKDEWTWGREAIVDGKIVDLTEIGAGNDLSVLKDMDQGAWFELRLDADGNVKRTEPKGDASDWAVELTFGAFADPGNLDQIDNVDDVDAAVNAKDTVLLQVEDLDGELRYKSGTLYTSKADTTGFSVSPDVKVVLCDADYEADDSYSGRSGLERAIRNLNDNFLGDLNVVFNKGDAVVIILVDKSEAGDDGGSELEEGVSITGSDVTIQYSGNQPNAASIIKSIISALESTGYTGVKDVSLDSGAGTYSATALVGTTETTVTGNYSLVNVTVNEESVDSLVEAIEGEDGNTYSFKGTILVDGNTVTFKNVASGADEYAANNTNLMNDLSRFLRGLRTEMDVKTIKFDGKTYKWDENATHPDPGDPDAEPLPVKGSKWHSGNSYQASNDVGDPGTTLVGALMEAGKAELAAGGSLDGMSFTLTLDGTDFTVIIKKTA